MCPCPHPPLLGHLLLAPSAMVKALCVRVPPTGKGLPCCLTLSQLELRALGHRVQVLLSLPRPLACPSCGLSVPRGCGSPGLQRDGSLRAGPGADVSSLPGLLPSRQHHAWPGVKADASGGPRPPASCFLTHLPRSADRVLAQRLVPEAQYLVPVAPRLVPEVDCLVLGAQGIALRTRGSVFSAAAWTGPWSVPPGLF